MGGGCCSGSTAKWTRSWTVVVLTDRGLYARWLYREIVALGWHPLMRITRRNRFLPAGWVHHQPAVWCGSLPEWAAGGRVAAWRFPTTPESRLACTLPGLLDGGGTTTAGTSSPTCHPQVAEAAWYGLRMGIEHGFEQFKSAGWQWQKSRMTDPDRARHPDAGWRSRWRRGGWCRWEAKRTPVVVRSRRCLPWRWVGREVGRGRHAPRSASSRARRWEEAPGFAAPGQQAAQGLGGRAGALVMGQ